MASTKWRKTDNLVEFIKNSFNEFDFFQLVYILDSLCKNQNSTKINNKFFDPNVIKFFSQIDLNFKPNTVSKLIELAQYKYNVQINFIGLAGPSGVLPPPYSAKLIEEDKNQEFNYFLSIFNHRLVEFHYLAWLKYRLYLRDSAGTTDLSDELSKLLKYLVGLPSVGLNIKSLDLKLQNSMLYFSGFNSKIIKTLEGLQNLLHSHFEFKVNIEAFKGKWLTLTDENTSMLPSRANPAGQFNRLAKDCVVGQRVWHSQSRFCISLGPLTNDQFTHFFLNTNALKQMKQLIRLYLGETYQFYIKVLLEPEVKVRSQLSINSAPILAWNCWLYTNKKLKREFILSNQ